MSFFADRSATDHKVRPVSRLTMTFMLLPVVVAGSFSRLLHTSLLHSALCDELMNVLDIRTQVTTNQYGHPKRRGMAWYSGRLEGIVGGSGTAVGTSISLADVMIYNTFAESLDEAESPQSECSTHSLALSLQPPWTKTTICHNDSIAHACSARGLPLRLRRQIKERGDAGSSPEPGGDLCRGEGSAWHGALARNARSAGVLIEGDPGCFITCTASARLAR